MPERQEYVASGTSHLTGDTLSEIEGSTVIELYSQALTRHLHASATHLPGDEDLEHLSDTVRGERLTDRLENSECTPRVPQMNRSLLCLASIPKGHQLRLRPESPPVVLRG